MTRKRILTLAAALLLAMLLTGCGAQKTQTADEASAVVATAEPDPNPPVQTPAPVEAEQDDKNDKDTPPEAPAAETTTAPTTAPAPVSVPTQAPTPAPTPEPTKEPVKPGTYTGSDGSVLTIKDDLSATYKTTLSGTVNGISMSGEVTFHGTVDADASFLFTKVTYLGMDVTSIAAQNGYGDATPWQNAASALYEAQS